MKLAIVGSRSFKDEGYIWQEIERFIRDHSHARPVILSGGASGVDEYAKRYAEKWNLNYIVFQPYFVAEPTAKFKALHYFVRNRQIVDNADKVLAFWDGISKGTDYTVQYAKKIRTPVMVIQT